MVDVRDNYVGEQFWCYAYVLQGSLLVLVIMFSVNYFERVWQVLVGCRDLQSTLILRFTNSSFSTNSAKLGENRKSQM